MNFARSGRGGWLVRDIDCEEADLVIEQSMGLTTNQPQPPKPRYEGRSNMNIP